MSPEAPDRKAAIRADLAGARQVFLDAVTTLRPADYGRSAGHESDWTVKDLLGHVAYAEGSMLPLIEAPLKGQARHVPPDFDLARWNEGRVRRAREQTVEELLARLEESRARALALLEGLTGADLDRPTSHPIAPETDVAGIFRIIARHEREHAAELRAASGQHGESARAPE